MDKTLARKYYGQKEIQEALLSFAKDREIAIRFGDFFGRRPQILENFMDIKDAMNKGASSFHASEERWLNPLLLANQNLTEDDKNKNRVGWDLILDLDGVDFIYSKLVAVIIIDHLDSLGVKNVSIKFSGNKGFHIGIPFEAFSQNILGVGETRLLFPDVPRKIAAYLMHELREKIVEAIHKETGTIDEIAKKYELEKKDITLEDGTLNYIKLIEIDTILIASRHLFRMPYSLHEKSGLASIPIPKEKINDFERFWAKPLRVKPQYHTKYSFLRYDSSFGRDADILLEKALEEDYIEEFSRDVLDAVSKSTKNEGILEITEEISLKDFPYTIQHILANQFPDGKKRALFVLLTFLFAIKWEKSSIEDLVYEWNDKQEQKLRNQYVQAQITWFENQEKPISPPNYDNDNYYAGIGIPDDIISKDMKKIGKMSVKNPLQYVYVRQHKKNKK